MLVTCPIRPSAKRRLRKAVSSASWSWNAAPSIAPTDATSPLIRWTSLSTAWIPAVISIPPPDWRDRCQGRRFSSIHSLTKALVPATGRPIRPLRRKAWAACIGRKYRVTWPIVSRPGARSAAATMASQSGSVAATGFSSRTCLPAPSAATAISRCISCGVAITTTSTDGSPSSAAQSVWGVPPWRAAKAATASASLRQTAVSRAPATSRSASAWTAPKWPAPMMPMPTSALASCRSAPISITVAPSLARLTPPPMRRPDRSPPSRRRSPTGRPAAAARRQAAPACRS